MADRSDSTTLATRTKILFGNFLVFYIAFVLTTNKWLPAGGIESAWVFSGIALWFLTLLSAPWFVPPRDVLISAGGASIILVTFDLQSVPAFRHELEVLRWVAVVYCAVVVALSIASLLLHSRDPQDPRSRLTFRLNNVFGRGEILFTPPALISILGAYQTNFASLAWLLVLWTLFAIAKPIERAVIAWRQWIADTAVHQKSDTIGVIDRIDHPNIVRIRLNQTGKWKPGRLFVAAMPNGDQRYVLALFMQVQGSEVIGTGLCVATLQESIPLPTGRVCLSHEEERAAEFIEALSGTRGSKLIGFTVENSTIGTLRFEVAADSSLEEGEVVFARIDGKDVFYQILDAETAEESFDQNPRGTHIVRAAQLGIYDSDRGFTKFPWLPAMNTPLFSAKARVFPEPTMSDREFIIGNVPSANVGVSANIDDLIEYHTAILGVTGTGKTELALDIVREAVARNVKVFCVDFTGDYRQRLADLNPIFPAPSQDEADDLQTRLFDVETGKFGAPDEKKVLKECVDALRESTAVQVEGYLENSDTNLAIFEMTEITNSKATLRLTELYLSTIMSWAREHRRAKQIMIVLEEAHTIVPETGGAGFDFDTQWVVGRIGQIALQGRKYGVGLLVVTQRTALVSKTILSQCNTFLTHSLIDQTSLNFLESVYSNQHTRLIPNLANFQFLAFGKALKADRPVLLQRDFDPAKKEASDNLRRPLEPATTAVS